MINRALLAVSVLAVCLASSGCMLLVLGPAMALPSTQVAFAQRVPITSEQLRSDQANLMGEIVAVRGVITGVTDETYVIDDDIATSIRGVDWPLRSGDRVTVQGYLERSDSTHARFELRHPFLSGSPRRTAHEVCDNLGAYKLRFVRVSGRVTANEGDHVILDGCLVLEKFSRLDPLPSVGDTVTYSGQVLSPQFGKRFPRIEFPNRIGD